MEGANAALIVSLTSSYRRIGWERFPSPVWHGIVESIVSDTITRNHPVGTRQSKSGIQSGPGLSVRDCNSQP